jgi:hypothetical protein
MAAWVGCERARRGVGASLVTPAVCGAAARHGDTGVDEPFDWRRRAQVRNAPCGLALEGGPGPWSCPQQARYGASPVWGTLQWTGVPAGWGTSQWRDVRSPCSKWTAAKWMAHRGASHGQPCEGGNLTGKPLARTGNLKSPSRATSQTRTMHRPFAAALATRPAMELEPCPAAHAAADSGAAGHGLAWGLLLPVCYRGEEDCGAVRRRVWPSGVGSGG